MVKFDTLNTIDHEEEMKYPAKGEEKADFNLNSHKQHQKIENPWIDKAIHGEYLERTKVS